MTSAWIEEGRASVAPKPIPERHIEPENAAHGDIVHSRFLTKTIVQNAEKPGNAVEGHQIKPFAQTNGNGNGNGHGNEHSHANRILEDDLDTEFERF